MSTALITVSRMAKEGIRKGKRGRPPVRPTSKPGERSPAYIVYARIDPAIGMALDRWMHSVDPKPTNTSAVEHILRAFLESKGFWPPSA